MSENPGLAFTFHRFEVVTELAKAIFYFGDLGTVKRTKNGSREE
jgi:hypothetical protein